MSDKPFKGRIDAWTWFGKSVFGRMLDHPELAGQDAATSEVVRHFVDRHGVHHVETRNSRYTLLRHITKVPEDDPILMEKEHADG